MKVGASRFMGFCSLNLSMEVLVLMIGWMAKLLQSAPVVLPPNWIVVNNSTLSPNYKNISQPGYWPTILSSPSGSAEFGFVESSQGYLSTLAIAFTPDAYGFYYFEVIWSANRNSPVGMNATLSLSGGNLVLRDNDTSLVWSTQVPPGKSITSVDMQDDGNLVMRDAENQTLWESFQHPTDTLVLGQQLGYKMALVASSLPTDGSEGSYKMVVESEALVLYTTLGATSSPPQAYQVLGGVGSTFDKVIHSNDNSTYAYIQFQREAGPGERYANVLAVCDKSDNCFTNLFGGIYGNSVCFLRLDYDGVLRWYYYDDVSNSWTPLTMTTESTDPCLLPAYCGPYGICNSGGTNGDNCNCPSGGGPRLDSIFQFRNASDAWEGCNPTWNSTSCVNGDSDLVTEILELQNVAYVPNSYLPASATNVSSTKCVNMCLSNCSCAASFFWTSSTSLSRCFLVSDLLSMYSTTSMSSATLPEVGGQYSAFIKYSFTKDLKNGISAWKLGVIFGCGGLVLISLCVCICASLSVRTSEEDEAFLESLSGLPPRFSFKDLDTATKHFSKILGEGGFGTVYEGTLSDGSKVAVKRLGRSTAQGQREFRAEVATIGGINHLRLVRLWGFCAEGTHRMLVYEHMENGSLDRWLFRQTILLSWPIRYQIAVDTAHALSYLHQDCRHKIIHLDVKPQNILLDSQFRAKVADFGMSKLYDQEVTKVVTKMRGTPGYMAPEWLLQAGVTVKCDVFSYGMVLLELVSGRRNLDVNTRPEKWYFPAWALQRLEVKSWIDIVDFRLESSLTSDDWAQVKRVVKIAIWCIQEPPHLRPTMAMVGQMLEGIVEVDDPPPQYDFLAMGSATPPLFVTHSHSVATGSASEDLQSSRVVEFGSFCNPDSLTYVSCR